jgi:iron complex transport system ATP-binding protein
VAFKVALKLWVHGLKMQYDAHSVLVGLEMKIEQGELVALLGANGAGKSTLLRCISKVVEPSEGLVYLDGKDMRSLTSREIARSMAVVPQETNADFDFTVEEIVLMGRFPHLGRFETEGAKERKLAWQAMEMTGVAHLARRSITTLSGGERQRVIMARAICQEPQLLLLDEPTANLDIGYECELLELVAALNREKRITIIAAIHDLNLATQYFDRFILLANGRVLSAGSAEEVITAENIKASYGVPAVIYRHPLHGQLQVCVPKQYPLKEKKKKMRVHVIGGGAEALPVLESLRTNGYSLSVGPVSTEDSSYHYAVYHHLPVVVAPPFSQISDEAHAEHLRLIQEAGLIVVPPIPFGEGNLRNLLAVEQALDTGKPVFLLEGSRAAERDYTGGKAERIIKKMKRKGASWGAELEAVIIYLRNIAQAPASK